MSEQRTIDPMRYGTRWCDVAIQVERRGSQFTLNISRVFENGEQDTVAIRVNERKAKELETFWNQP